MATEESDGSSTNVTTEFHSAFETPTALERDIAACAGLLVSESHPDGLEQRRPPPVESVTDALEQAKQLGLMYSVAPSGSTPLSRIQSMGLQAEIANPLYNLQSSIPPCISNPLSRSSGFAVNPLVDLLPAQETPSSVAASPLVDWAAPQTSSANPLADLLPAIGSTVFVAPPPGLAASPADRTREGTQFDGFATELLKTTSDAGAAAAAHHPPYCPPPTIGAASKNALCPTPQSSTPTESPAVRREILEAFVRGSSNWETPQKPPTTTTTTRAASVAAASTHFWGSLENVGTDQKTRSSSWKRNPAGAAVKQEQLAAYASDIMACKVAEDNGVDAATPVFFTGN